MKVGYLCKYAAEEIAFATEAGFGSIQLLIYPGDPLDPATTSEDEIKAARDAYGEAGIEVSALGYYRNHIAPDPAEAAEVREHFVALFDTAEIMGVDCICTFAGRDPDKSVLDNIPAFAEVFTDHAKLAEDRGMTIGFENCPMFHYFPFRGVNIAFCPEAWDAMFDAVPSMALGIEYDPSHLICMFMDYLQIIHDYGDRIVHVHAKDAEVVWPEVKRNGILYTGAVRHRTPGMGDADWAQIISALHEIGYEGNLDIEGRHDPVYKGARENEGLVISLRHLSEYIADEFVK